MQYFSVFSLINMEWLTILAILLVIGFVVFMLRADADLITLYCSKWGRKPEHLAGKVVWITGASSGIGENLAYELAAAGCKLVLSARRKEELERVKKHCMTCGKLSEDDIQILTLDIVDFDKHAEATQNVLQNFKQIDILVNNAGRSQRAIAYKTALEVDEEMMKLNYLGTVSITKAVLPHMISRKGGHIVVTSSIAGKVPSPVSAAYTATKHALQGYFDALRIELCLDNINITMVCPGPVISNITQVAFTELPGKMYGQPMEEVKKMSTERCAELMAVAIANKLNETWITDQPILFFTYFSQFMPSLAKRVGNLVGSRIIRRLEQGKSPY